MISVRFKSGSNRGVRLNFDKSRIVFGRALREVDVVVHDEGVLDVHCQLTQTGDRFQLVFFDSSSPGEATYSGGDEFVVGETTFEIVASAWAKARKTRRVSTPVDATEIDLRVPSARQWDNTIVRLVPSDCVVINSLEAEGDPAEVLGEHEGKCRLIFLTGPHTDRHVFLGKCRVVLGRSEDAHVPIFDSLLEAHHAAIRIEDDNHYIQKMSDAPVLLNGRPIEESRLLGQGDIITIGSSDIEFQRGDVDLDSPDGMTTIAVPMPRFAFMGEVKMQQTLSIGREPAADLFLDDRRVERRHAEIYFDLVEFRLKDLSRSGIRVNGKRAVDEQLQDGDSIQLGAFELRVRVQAYRCSIEVIPPEPDVEIPRYVEDNSTDAFFKTMYRMPAGLKDELARRQDEKTEEEEKDRRSVLWVTPDDVKRNLRHPLVFAAGMVASLGIMYFSFAEAGVGTLLRPLSAAHSEPEFILDASQKFGVEDGCAGCHASKPTVADACQGCHGTSALRPQHASVRESDCSACHSEHAVPSNSAMVPSARCVGCHQERHARFRPFDPGPSPVTPKRREGFVVDLKADLAFDEKARVEALHETHKGLDARCKACHVGSDGEERAEGEAYRACFGCHGPKEALELETCGDCHREHGDAWASPALPGETAVASSWGGWTVASVASLMMLSLVGFTLGVHQVGRRRSQRREDADPPPPPRTDGVIQCGGSGRGVARRLPRVSINRCTGSGDCADACPYDVLHLEDGLPRVVRPELCHECMTCVSVCGPQALSMAVPGEPPPMISVPSLDANFQTGLGAREDGIYIIGDAAGKPLVKNGNNLGRWVVEHMLSEGIAPGSAEQGGLIYEVVIIGSGPAGLSAGLCAHEAGLSYVILEKGTGFATTIHGYPKKKKLMPSPEHVENIGPLPVWDATREEVLEAWTKKLSDYELSLVQQVSISSIEVEGEGFVVKSQQGDFRGLRVVIACGSRGEPRKLGKPGEDLPKVLYRLADPEAYDRKHCMVVGGGDSAIEAACALAGASGGSNRVSIVYRQDRFSRAKKANQDQIVDMITTGKIEAFLETNPIEVKEKSVILERKDGETREVPNDFLFCMLGANPPTKWLERLGIEIVQKPADWDPGRSDQFAFRNFSHERSGG